MIAAAVAQPVDDALGDQDEITPEELAMAEHFYRFNMRKSVAISYQMRRQTSPEAKKKRAAYLMETIKKALAESPPRQFNNSSNEDES